ncbi:MAG: S41 family peptidase [Candidatus Marinimicrobia bacterium]|jgi:hypothetical protein|nr:S41 family peptidase [Candidatus Neomarinimicrobiota bacterium]MDD5710027.1 S41 family peptidase [Candidatus Neomarinimicrobiota bacterium]
MKNKSFIRVSFLLLALAFLNSCEYLFFKPLLPSTAQSTFDYLWNRVNEQYAFFDVKNVDWDEVYTRYAPGIHEDLPDDSLFFHLGSMLNELRDGHVNLFSEFNISRFDITLLGPQNLDYRLVKEHYLGNDFYITGPFQHNFIAGGRAAYVRYASFSSNFSNENLRFIFERYKDCEGLLLDLRQNGGGIINNVYQLLSYFIADETHIYNSCIKSGPGHDAFGDPEAVIIPPHDTLPAYTAPVAVLIDRGSYSATSLFSLATLALDNMFLVGDTSGGGLGMPNGGQLPNGWTYRFSITRTLSLDGLNFENGVVPDIHAVLDPADQLLGLDSVIEAALDSLLRP